MDDFISRKAAITTYKTFGHLNLRNVLEAFDAIPAADARPVVRGEWVVSRTDYGWNGAEFPTHCKCTECGREVPYQDKDNFCPNCGADMRPEPPKEE